MTNCFSFLKQNWKGLFCVIERTQPAITCSKLTIETLEQGVKYVHLVAIVNFEHKIAGWGKSGGLLFLNQISNRHLPAQS